MGDVEILELSLKPTLLISWLFFQPSNLPTYTKNTFLDLISSI